MIVLPLASLVLCYDEDLPIDLGEITDFMVSLAAGEYVPPIEVRRLPGGFWQIHNGRRRFIAHAILGLKFINAEEVP